MTCFPVFTSFPSFLRLVMARRTDVMGYLAPDTLHIRNACHGLRPSGCWSKMYRMMSSCFLAFCWKTSNWAGASCVVLYHIVITPFLLRIRESNHVSGGCPPCYLYTNSEAMFPSFRAVNRWLSYHTILWGFRRFMWTGQDSNLDE